MKIRIAMMMLMLANATSTIAAQSSSCPVNQIQAAGPYILDTPQFEQCLENLQLSSADDVSLTKSEYVDYLNLSGVDTTSTSSFDDLAYPLRRAYSISACNCIPSLDESSATSCCADATAAIDISDSNTSSMLFKICGRIEYGIYMLNVPTNAPTVPPQPSSAPSESPISLPSASPSVSPTSAPTLYTGPLEIVFEYDMYTDSQMTSSEILADDSEGGIQNALMDATESIALQVLEENYPNDDRFNNRQNRRRRRRKLRTTQDQNRHRRRLTVTYQTTEIQSLTANGCNYEGNNLPANALCYIVGSTVVLELVNENKDQVYNTVLEGLNDSLSDGSFLKASQESSSGSGGNTDVIIGVNPPSTVTPVVGEESGSSSEALHPGIYAGMALAGAAVLLGAGFVQYRRQQRKKATSMYSQQGRADGTLGADEIHYMLHGSTRRSADFREIPYDDDDDRAAELSVGSSGWSSNGTSTANSRDYREHGRGSSLAAVAVASGAHGRITSTSNYGNGVRILEEESDDDDDVSSSQSETSSELIGNLTRKSQLQRQHQQDQQQQQHLHPGVTRNDLDAAIDAADWATVGATAALLANSNISATPLSTTSSNRTGMSNLDQQRANELDHLVDTGDWEGVVLAAAKFESSPAGGYGIRSDDSSSMDPSAAGTAFTVNASLGSETPSNLKKRAEIRAEVDDLVRKVVPDEAENIDEMMRQFYGREEELLETLRSMQERAIAQRQRWASQKSAKREAQAVQLKSVANGAPAPEGEENVTTAGSNAETSTVFSDPQFEGIQTEDIGSGSGSGSKTAATGDGSGFGGVPPAVALRKTEEDDEKERLEKEEQDALAQAAIWKKIAAANKPQEDAMNSEQTKGARAAADWAIERSLSALKNVEKGSKSGSGISSFSGSMDEVIEEDEV
eukprot:CAMPEP_0196806586 /NCGR_PEP_ID=MMETSP1362-20130617/6474_1 /TAXON_ID=163516 /ORGANISM="Leptocylindrus danicus, Strain CCMP1856" /LENGTH=911 /DNA_ID=CAMNT_0042180121 /DNA_START=487 /DNA_END=3222 /DNA_ORIENTATION=-